MQRCPAPCCDRVDAESYAQLVRGTVLFLRGHSSELLEELEARMREAAAQDRFYSGNFADLLGMPHP